jgi:CBS domain-containing protein
VDTSEIRYRVADFLKQHPPFNAVDDQDLVALAAHGRVRFFPNDEFLAWQGEPHKTHVLVIQQGTVSLWDERDGQAELRDVRGPGDWIGAEQFYGAPACLYTARASSDVVTYGFPAYDLDEVLGKYPQAAAFVAAMGSVTSAFAPTDSAAAPLEGFLQPLAGPLTSCDWHTSVAEAARLLLRSGADALAVTDGQGGFVSVLTSRQLLGWIAEGAVDPNRPVRDIGGGVAAFVGADASVADGAWAMIEQATVVMTANGTESGRVLSLVTPHDLLPALGDQPAAIYDDVQRATTIPQLRALNHRARAFALKYLTRAASIDWMTQFTAGIDKAIVTRVLALEGQAVNLAGWCVCGTSGRSESLTPRLPQLVWLQDATSGGEDGGAVCSRLNAALEQCGYLADPESPHDPSFYAASLEEWASRYVGWIRNPVIEGMQRNRALFDLRPLGNPGACIDLVKTVRAAVNRDFLQILAHDCLADLPPLSFYEGAVVEHSGEYTDVFRLQRNVLQPLVDLGRVFGMAAGDVMATSTLERFAAARRFLPAHERIFREAADALRIVLWQQGRVGISQGSVGAELPASLLSRSDRHMLRSAFPVIQELIEFTANPAWLDAWDVAVDRKL